MLAVDEALVIFVVFLTLAGVSGLHCGWAPHGLIIARKPALHPRIWEMPKHKTL
jgi:hypothetical protein